MKNIFALILTLCSISLFAQNKHTINLGTPQSDGGNGLYLKNVSLTFTFLADGNDGQGDITVYLTYNESDLRAEVNYYLYNGSKYYFANNSILVDANNNVVYTGISAPRTFSSFLEITARTNANTAVFSCNDPVNYRQRKTVYEGKENKKFDEYKVLGASAISQCRYRDLTLEKRIDEYLNKKSAANSADNSSQGSNSDAATNSNESSSNSSDQDNSSSTSSSKNSNQEQKKATSEEDKMLDSEYSPEAIDRKNKARAAESERRRAEAERQNQQIQENTAAMGAAMLVLGGFIYQNYGSMGEVYTGDNFLFGLEAGFGLTVDPEIFTIDLNLKPKFGYQRLINFNSSSLIEAIEVGATLAPHLTLGLRPDLAYQTSYVIGGRVFGGFPSFKGFYDYESGVREFGLPEGNGFANGYDSHKFGFQLSFYNNSKTFRNHFYFGLIRENVNGYGDSEGGVYSPYTYNGYMFEWYKEHHGRLFVHWIPAYKTNPSAPALEEEVYLIKAGFSRVLETFEPRNSRERKRQNEKGQKVKVNRDDASYMMYTRDKQNYYGLEIGSLKKNEITYYLNITGGSPVYDSISSTEDIENDGESSSVSHFFTTGRVEEATLFVISAGVNKKILNNLFAFGGLGLGYSEQYEEVLEFDTFIRDPFDPSAESELVWYHNVDEARFRIFPELGLKYKAFDRLVLKYGLSYRGSLISQLGIGFAFY